MNEDIVAIIMVFSIPLVAILTGHLSSTKKLKSSMLKDELELEKTKQQNYLIETEKMKVELEKMKLELELKEGKSNAIPSYKKADVNDLLPKMEDSQKEETSTLKATTSENEAASSTSFPKDEPTSESREKEIEYVRVR